MYQRKVDMDMLNAIKSVLADVSSVSPSSEQRRRANARNVSQHTLYGIQHIHINLVLIDLSQLCQRRACVLVYTLILRQQGRNDWHVEAQHSRGPNLRAPPQLHFILNSAREILAFFSRHQYRSLRGISVKHRHISRFLRQDRTARVVT